MRIAALLAVICLTNSYAIIAQVAPPATEPSSVEPVAIYKDEISGFHPGDANALDVVNLLNDQFPNLTFSAEPTTNRIYARVPKSLIDEIDQFIQELATVAADYKQRQERLRRQQLDEEAHRQKLVEEQQREAELKRQQELQARQVERGLSNSINGLNTGITFQTPLGMRLAQTQLRAANLKFQKLMASHGPDHPSVRSAELEIQAIQNLISPQIDLLKQYRFVGNNKPFTEYRQLEFLTKIMKQLRPDLKVELAGIDNGVVIFKGSQEAVAEAQRIMKALEEVAHNSDPATLQQLYENAEKNAAKVAEQLSNAKDDDLKTDLNNQLRDAVKTAFELRMQLQQSQLEQAEADLLTARTRLIRREQLAEQIIERRIEELKNIDETSWFPRQPRTSEENQASPSTPSPENALPTKDGQDDKISELNNWQNSFGIEFGEAVRLSGSKSAHRGGIQIKSVIKKTPAEKAGIQTGDILIGIGSWETTSPSDLTYIFNEIKESANKDSVKFYVLRKDETVYGHMTIPKSEFEFNPVLN